MSYGLIYTIPFATLKNESCIVEIEKEDYVGVVTELTPGESPFTVEIDDDDFMYVPTRFSSANIRVVGSDYLRHLYSTAYQQYRVTLKRNGAVTWCGFIKPELYTQDYSSNLFELEIECQSAMSTLEFIPYKQMKEDGKDFVSLWNLVKKGIELSNARYNAVYIPYVYSKSESGYKAGTDNVLSEMTVSEQDFFDEDDKAMTNKEILEEICKLLNWTCVDWKGELYFVDMDHEGDYRRYSSNLETWEPVSLPGVLNVQKAGFAGNDHTLDLVPGFNKVTVKTSNYSVGDLTTEEDYDKLEEVFMPQDVTVKGNDDETQQVSRKILLLPKSVKMYQWVYENGKITPVSKDWIRKNKEKANLLLGAMPVKYCLYEKKNKDGVWVPSISGYTFENAVHVRWRDQSNPENDTAQLIGQLPIVTVKIPSAIYSDGAFGISGQMCNIRRSDMGIILYSPERDQTASIKCSLKIGEKWYNGERFLPAKSTFNVPFNATENSSTWVNIKNTKTLDMPYDGLTGYVIQFGEKPIFGELEFTIYASYPEAYLMKLFKPSYGLILKDIKLEYKKTLDSNSDDNSDRYYENVVNENYINELDEIEFKISSYNNDGACYSKVMLGDNYLTDNLYSATEEKLIRPEEQLIRRIINRYSDTHIKLTQEIQETAKITPITRLSDNFMVDKIFMNIGGSIDYKMGKFRCVMVEV